MSRVRDGAQSGVLRRWFTELFAWYANEHRHSGLALLTPVDVFFGRVESPAQVSQRALDAGFSTHPERFVEGRPDVRRAPKVVAFNPVDPTGPKPVERLLNANGIESMTPNPTPRSEPPLVLPAQPCTRIRVRFQPRPGSNLLTRPAWRAVVDVVPTGGNEVLVDRNSADHLV